MNAPADSSLAAAPAADGRPPDAVVRCPALLVAAPASGQGKTTVVAALARLLTRRGWRVRVFKCGPDFLDPFWHQLASGQVVHNLDGWMTGEADMRARLHAAAAQADVLLVEGVMGLHDGAHSSARLARTLGLPVLLVAQAARMAQTLGALVYGMRHYRAAADGPLPWAGVLANGISTAAHGALLREAMLLGEQVAAPVASDDGDDGGDARLIDSGWLGHVPPHEDMRLPERHLGLVAAHELGQTQALARLDAAADVLQDTPLGRMTLDDWRARWTVCFAPVAGTADEKGGQGAGMSVEALPALLPWLAGRTVAVARDAAFAFIYPANLDTLRAMGAQLVFFSPLAGDALPDCDALWLPGGYPELHASALSAQAALRQQLHAHAQAGKPIWAECGGMMALFDELVDAQGQTHAMWGLLPGRSVMQKRLGGLGQQQWVMSAAAGQGGDGAPATETLRGHTFHYSLATSPLAAAAHTQPVSGHGRKGEAVWVRGAVRASYFHAWFASHPRAAARLFLPDALPHSAHAQGDAP